MTMDPKPCEHCAEMFVPVRFATTRFCSQRCRSAQYRQDNKEHIAKCYAQWQKKQTEINPHYRRDVKRELKRRKLKAQQEAAA